MRHFLTLTGLGLAHLLHFPVNGYPATGSRLPVGKCALAKNLDSKGRDRIMKIVDVIRGRMKRSGLLAVIFFVWIAVPGCVVQEMGANLSNSLKGEYYLKAKDTAAGEEHFRQEVEAEPENPLSNYYYGRLLLRSEKAKVALPYLQQAGRLDPEKAEYQFWTGVAYGLLHQRQQERAKYEQAIRLDPEYGQALTSLGHWHLRQREYARALQIYEKALAIQPNNPAALYNKALSLSKLGRRQEEQRGWHRYLAVNPSGGLAVNAVEHLNTLGDFSYRNYRLGARTVTVEKIRFSPSRTEVAKESLPALKMIGEAVGSMESGVLQVVVYQNNDVDLARVRAQSIRRFLLNNISGLRMDRIGISWFAEPQRNPKKKWIIEESVDFFLVSK